MGNAWITPFDQVCKLFLPLFIFLETTHLTLELLNLVPLTNLAWVLTQLKPDQNVFFEIHFLCVLYGAFKSNWIRPFSIPAFLRYPFFDKNLLAEFLNTIRCYYFKHVRN